MGLCFNLMVKFCKLSQLLLTSEKEIIMTVTKTTSTASWAKSGAAANAEMQKYEKEIAIQQELNKRMWRFWLTDGEEGRITFVDGDILPDNTIDYFMYYEHNLMLNGKWGNTFVCTKDIEPCPLCEAGDRSSFVGVFTVIDHREYKSKDGKIFKDVPKLFVAKKDTIKTLQMLGAKRGGLSGCTFDVPRSGDKSPSVGSIFDFLEKTPVEDLKKKYVRKNDKGVIETFFVPASYEHECQYRTADELRAAIPSLASVAPMGHVTAADKALADQL